jgi:peroxiredoxin (alkyl hydroperoxide reductase subunit C)
MKAPDFTANSTMGPLTLSDYNGKWVILFSHPGDFTPVCTTEFVAFAQAEESFSAKNTQLIGLSIDSNPSHLAWVYSIYTTTGITIPFPVIADRMADVANLYGMIAPDVSNEETVRNVYFIDPQQIIRAILVYPLTNGRSIPEILRLLTALQTTDQYKVVTPANWQPGQPTMAPPPQTYDQLMERVQNPEALDLECKAWYWCYNTELPASSRQRVLYSPAGTDAVKNKYR